MGSVNADSHCNGHALASKDKRQDADAKVFNYDNNSLITDKTTKIEPSCIPQNSKFDEFLIKSWENAMNNGCFRYNLESVQRKRLDGCTKLVAQLNCKRFSDRRKPQPIRSIFEPFSTASFNFNKVSSNEVLFELAKTDSVKDTNHLVIVNVSPIEFGHVLIVPDAKECLNQVLTEESIQLAMEICLLSQHRGLRVGFNSLCAFASVNHLHFHAMYIPDCLPIDNAEVCSVGNGLLELVKYPVLGFAFNVKPNELSVMARKIICVVNRMVELEIPHNIFMSRGDSLSNELNEDGDVVRVFIFPKIMSTGLKNTQTLNSCCYDLAGYLLMKDEQQYRDMDEIEAVTILNKYTYRQDEFDELKLDLLQASQAKGF